MTVNEYLIELEEELKYLPKNKRKQLVTTYRTKFNVEIDLGTPEEKITAAYKLPREVAKELYEAEGINYLERRKRATKSNNVFKIILSIIGLILTFSAALILTYYMGYSVFRLIKLMFYLKGAKEIILMLLFVIPFVVLLLTIYLYLVDIVILIFNFLLERIMYSLGKTYKYGDFSIIDIIEEKIKKEKVFKKVLIFSAVFFVLFGFVNFFMRTYLYRSFKKVASDNYEITETIETDKTKLVLNVDEAKVNFVKGDTLTVNIKSEFERSLLKETYDDCIYISTDKLAYFDFLDFLKEPEPIITITIPDSFSLAVEQDNGTLQVNELLLNELNLSLDQGNLIVVNSNSNDTILKTYLGGINVDGLNTTNLTINGNGGSCTLKNVQSTNQIIIENITTECKLDTITSPKLEHSTHTGNIDMKNLVVEDISVSLAAANADLFNVKSNKIHLTSTGNANVSYASVEVNDFESITLGGGVVFLNFNAASAHIETAGTLLAKNLSGTNYEINCIGNFLTIEESELTSISVSTQRCETTIQYIKSDVFKYTGDNSKSVLYFIFGKDMSVEDFKGEVHLDNDKTISTNLENYDKYYQKIESLYVSSNVSYRVENASEILSNK